MKDILSKKMLILSFCLCFIQKNISINTNISTYFSTFPNEINSTNDVYVTQIELDKAWDVITGSSSTRIGVIDSGISSTPLDFNGILSSSLNKDCLNLSRDPLVDGANHGTMVGGIVGAKGNNSYAKSGIMWKSTLVSLRVDYDYGYHLESVDGVINAVQHAIDYNIPILNFSGGFYDNTISTTQKNNLLNKIANYSGLFVCSAGNESTNLDTTLTKLYPQCFDLDNILVVGACTSDDDITYYSNIGEASVDLFAPTDILTTNGTYGGTTTFGGTSCSSPVVAGVAGLMKSIKPSLTTAQIKSALLNNVDINSYFLGNCSSGGRVNAYKSVLSILPTHTVGATFTSTTSIDVGGHQWFRINASQGTYSFKNNSSMNLTGSLYNDIQGVCLSTGSSNGNGEMFGYNFTSSGTYYLRIDNNSPYPSTYSIAITNGHVHNYTYSYQWKSNTQHYSYCSCSNRISEFHVVHSGQNTCLLCGGYASIGIIQNSSNSNFLSILNDSYCSSNGVIVLGDVDYESYLRGALLIDDIYSEVETHE